MISETVCSHLLNLLRFKYVATAELLEWIAKTHFKDVGSKALLLQFMQDFTWCLKMADMRITMVYNHNNLMKRYQMKKDKTGFFEIFAEAKEASNFVLNQLQHANRIGH